MNKVTLLYDTKDTKDRKEVIVMARPRKYASTAQKQAAYRARLDASTTVVDRAALDCLHRRLDQLQSAVSAAARSGDPFARRCCASSVDTMLEKLVTAFMEEAIQRTPAGAVQNR